MYTVLGPLFEALDEADYQWFPQTPDRLLSFRKEPDPFRPLIQWAGLGLPVVEPSLVADGLPAPLLETLKREDFATGVGPGQLQSLMAVSGTPGKYLLHDHWPPNEKQAGGYVHCGPESALLVQELSKDIDQFKGWHILDLGCSSGALALNLAGAAAEVLGLDVSERAIRCARATAETYGLSRVRFEVGAIGKPEADALVASREWDCAVMNPPMMIPMPHEAHPHRDGGKLGVELPLAFLDFAHRHLRRGGELIGLITNPIVNGRQPFFEALGERSWEVLEKRRLHSHFNQAAARKQGYHEQGIERVELWLLRLARKN